DQHFDYAASIRSWRARWSRQSSRTIVGTSLASRRTSCSPSTSWSSSLQSRLVLHGHRYIGCASAYAHPLCQLHTLISDDTCAKLLALYTYEGARPKGSIEVIYHSNVLELMEDEKCFRFEFAQV